MQKYFPNEMIDKKYGNLTVISVEKQNGKTFLKCKCDCNNYILRETYMIATGIVKSCGCSKKLAFKNRKTLVGEENGNYKDGRSKHPLYGTWVQMISRCKNPKNRNYDRYGGRGIIVCDEWQDFWSFVKWSDSIGGRPNNCTLDRIDNNGNYEPENCRWADWRTQTTNKSSNVYIEYNGVSKTITEWCEELNIHTRTLNNRINRGWSIERALSECTSKNSHFSRNKFLCQYTKEGLLIAKYKSLSDLPDEFNKKCVSDCANGRRKTNKGYIWKYEDE